MLPTKLLIIAIITLISLFPSTDSLPITSKPIESTAENLAWEAWLMVPVGQQLKTRKVTPKSIFIVPQKKNQTAAVQCPPGEHFYESRCIPTVNIDTDKILLTQLTNLVYPTSDYDYDYEETGSDLPGSEKLEGESDGDVISTSLLDSADEPLKFDIFRDTFPIGSSGSGDSSGIKDTEEEQLFFVGGRRRRPPVPPEESLADLETDGSSQGTYNESTESDNKGNEEEPTLFLSEIDAILVPAGSSNQGNLNFSVYREGVNRTVSENVEQLGLLSTMMEKSQNLEKILEDESLMLDEDHETEEKEITTTSEVTETTTDLSEESTSTLRIEDEYENDEDKVEFTRSVVEQTSMTPLGSSEITSTEVSTTVPPNEDSTTITDQDVKMTTDFKDETTTTDSSPSIVDKVTEVEEKKTPIEEPEPLPEISDDRFFYHQISSTISSVEPSSSTTETPKNPPATAQVANVVAELKLINDLITKKRHLPPSNPTTITMSTTSAESSSKSNESWAKIIPPTVSSSTIRSSTTSNTLNNLSSSSINSSTVSTATRSSPTSSTSAKPARAEPDPFWWLPNGWRTDRTDTDRPLLLRFWSALSSISGSQAKV